ncbi:unnamed protein product [Strongylus vulgaris]|uniref:Uncharacterized protein n=1 Tax=Strongylus vulgaris TaxID=40348 RepID=A0A3P7KXH3_STRVU|nr:unnamed protein product [Strongylus vulgaris]
MEELSHAGSPDYGHSASARKRQCQSRLFGELNTRDIDITELPEGRFVGLARRSDITMVESQPIIWQRQDLFNDEVIQAPIDFSKERL